MKNRAGVIVLLILCLGLGVAVMFSRKQAAEEQAKATQQIDTLSNQWVKVSSDLDEQKKVATMLEKDMETKKKDYEKSIGELTNNYTQVSANLAKTEESLRAVE